MLITVLIILCFILPHFTLLVYILKILKGGIFVSYRFWIELCTVLLRHFSQCKNHDFVIFCPLYRDPDRFYAPAALFSLCEPFSAQNRPECFIFLHFSRFPALFLPPPCFSPVFPSAALLLAFYGAFSCFAGSLPCFTPAFPLWAYFSTFRGTFSCFPGLAHSKPPSGREVAAIGRRKEPAVPK